MLTISKKLATAIATSAILLQAVAPVAFADTALPVTGHDTIIQITGNGSYSDNDAHVSQKSDTQVVQTNIANVTNNVTSHASTGGNDANDNTGGDTAIKTGDAQSTANVSNTLNSNVADVTDCNCDQDTKVLISGNGSDSDNDVRLHNSNDLDVFQTNVAYVTNNVDTKASTGYNDANRNTGGDTTIITGNAKADASVSTVANANQARVSGRDGDGGSLQAIVTGNGSYSDNDIDIHFDRDTALVQDNYADVYNDVYAKAETGYNDANDNTGGDVAIKTGWAKAFANVDTMVNFNAADLDCGCLRDLKVKIDGNGYDSDNDVKVHLDDYKDLFQTNVDYTYNDVYAKAKTGDNDTNRNTGEVDNPNDPVVIITGNAADEANVDNTANLNVIGPGADFHFPDLSNVDFSFDFGSWFWGGWWNSNSDHTSH